MEHKAGRELDALVFQKIFDAEPPFCGCAEMQSQNGESFEGLNYVMRCVACGLIDPPGFSENISDAWEVVEKFQWAEPELKYSDEQHCWICSLHKANGYPAESADTAPLAICLAALKAVEGK